MLCINAYCHDMDATADVFSRPRSARDEPRDGVKIIIINTRDTAYLLTYGGGLRAYVFLRVRPEKRQFFRCARKYGKLGEIPHRYKVPTTRRRLSVHIILLLLY